MANSNAGIITSEISSTSATVDGTAKADSRANVSQAIYIQSQATSKQAAAFATGLPSNSDALSVLNANHFVHENFNLNSQGFGPASDMLGYTVLSGAYSGSSATSHTYSSDTQYQVNIGSLANPQHLLVGLLDPVISDPGDITSLQFKINRQYVTVVNQTFTNPTTAALNNFFDDHTFDLGNYSDIIGNSLQLDFSLTVTTAASSAAFNENLIFGNSTLLSGPLVGDFNRDGHVDTRDIAAAELALTNMNQYQSTYGIPSDLVSQLDDVNNDGVINNADVQALLNLLKNGGGSTTSVPEPASWILASLALAAFLSST